MNLLKQHPLVSFSERDKPEPKYFIQNPDANSDDFVRDLFPNIDKGAVCAEKSTSYHESIKALQRIKKEFPDALVVFVIRNPVDRYVSNFFFTKMHGLETRTIEEVVIEKKTDPVLSIKVSVNPFDYLKRTIYSSFLPGIELLFKDNLLVVDFQHLTVSPQELCNNIFKNLQLDDFEVNLAVGENKAKKKEIDPEVYSILGRELKNEVAFYEKTVGKYKAFFIK